MIKFKALIHKETRKVIEYEKWLELLKSNDVIVWKDRINNGAWQYKPRSMLFSDSFEIIYDYEFTTLELIQLYSNSGNLGLKLKKIIDERHNLKREYGIGIEI